MTVQESIHTAASQAAERNFSANVAALEDRQPLLASEIANDSPDVEWLLGRDGSLTARQAGQWWSGSSLPRRTARKLFEKVDLQSPVTCFLAPTHAAQLRVILDRLDEGRSMIAIVPDRSDLRLILGCEAFERDIAAGRLWFAWGDDWQTQLQRLLSERDGLALPGQFVRTTLVEADTIEAMITFAQSVFSREIARRSETIQRLFAEHADQRAQICLVAPALFRLWDDTGGILNTIAAAHGWRTLDPDDPCHASPVAFVRAVLGCQAVIAPTLGRSDFPQGLPLATKVITWVTQPRIPRFVAQATGDRLFLADERWRSLALANHWPASQIAVATWPTLNADPAGSGLGIIADTLPLAPPTFDLSSHKVLWESIAREVGQDPFSVGPDMPVYLNRWLTHTGIAAETIDQETFVRRLILPAYQQGLARCLLAAGIPTKLFGRGWSEIDEFKPHCAAAPMRTREDLRDAVAACRALVHVWPEPCAHPIEATSRPVLRVGSQGKEMWLAQAKRLARGEGRLRSRNTPELSAEIIRHAAGLA